MRWIAVSFVLGLCVAYALWGVRDAPAEGSAPGNTPGPDRTSVIKPGVSTAVSQLQFDPGQLELGEFGVSDIKTAAVLVKNPATAPVKVAEVRVSCACLSAQLKQRTLPPGGHAELAVKFTALAGARPQDYSVVLATDEPGTPLVVLPVHAKVRQDYLLEPQTLNFAKLARGSSKTLTTTLKRLDGQPFQIKDVQVSHSEFTSKWEALAGNTFSITVTAQAVRVGPISEGATVMITSPATALLPLYLNLDVPGEVVCDPAFVVAQSGPDKRAGTFDVEVRRLSAGAMNVKSVTESAGLAVTFTAERMNERSQKLHITITAPLPRSFALGDFSIQTDVEEQPLRLPYRVVQPYHGPEERPK